MHEIERKFLLNVPAEVVHAQALRDGTLVRVCHIEQSYLPKSGDWSVRVRKCWTNGLSKHFLTMKRRVALITCIEIEHEIPDTAYQAYLTQSGPTLTKTRSVIRVGKHNWEVDRFQNHQLLGLEIAEIELKDEQELFQRPYWIGQEVSVDKQYKNARLARSLAA